MAKLNLDPNPTFVSKVPICPPGDDSIPMMIPMTFIYRSKTDLQEWLSSREGKSDVESFMDMVKGWEADGLEFSKENIELVFDKYPGTPTSAVRVYLDQLTKARMGN